MVPIPCAKEATSELNNSSPQAMSMVAKNVTSIPKLPNNPPNPSSITDIPLMNQEKPGKKPEDEEMPPLVNITDEITGSNEDARRNLKKIFTEVVYNCNSLYN